MSKIYEALELARRKKLIPEKPPETPLPKTYREPASDLEVEEEMLTLYQNVVSALPDKPRPIIMLIGSQSK